MRKSHSRMEETTVKMAQRIHVLGETGGTQRPAIGLVATIWRIAIARKTAEWMSATTARLRFVRMENMFMSL
jgi:hypothetical protein